MVEQEWIEFGWRSWDGIQLAKDRTEWTYFVRALCATRSGKDSWNKINEINKRSTDHGVKKKNKTKAKVKPKQLSMAANWPSEMVVRMRDVLVTPGWSFF